MKKAFAILSSLFLLLSLEAAYFDSNALGQDLGMKEELSGAGYEGESSGGTTIIYLDGEPVRTRTDSENGYTVSEDGYSLSVVLDSSGRRISDTTDENGMITERVYSYDGDRLSSVAITDGSGISRIIEYIDTPGGHLAGLSGDEHSYLTPYYYVYTLDGDSVKVSLHTDGSGEEPLFIPDPAVYSVDENGNWSGTVTEEDGTEVSRVFSPEGRLISFRSGERSESYCYGEDGEIVQSDVIEGSVRTVSDYTDGKLLHEDIYIDDTLQKSRTYNEDGSIEEIRYRDGKRKSLILFDSDGLRIRRVENFR